MLYVTSVPFSSPCWRTETKMTVGGGEAECDQIPSDTGSGKQDAVAIMFNIYHFDTLILYGHNRTVCDFPITFCK